MGVGRGMIFENGHGRSACMTQRRTPIHTTKKSNGANGY